MSKVTTTWRLPDTDEIVIALLQARKGQWEAIAEGSGVSYSWVSKFMNGKIPNPGIETIKKLRVFMESKSPAA